MLYPDAGPIPLSLSDVASPPFTLIGHELSVYQCFLQWYGSEVSQDCHYIEVNPSLDELIYGHIAPSKPYTPPIKKTVVNASPGDGWFLDDLLGLPSEAFSHTYSIKPFRSTSPFIPQYTYFTEALKKTGYTRLYGDPRGNVVFNGVFDEGEEIYLTLHYASLDTLCDLYAGQMAAAKFAIYRRDKLRPRNTSIIPSLSALAAIWSLFFINPLTNNPTRIPGKKNLF